MNKQIIEENKIAPVKLGRCFLFDFETGQHVIQNGKLVECTKEQAIKQWIRRLIMTKQGKFRVYDGSKFGLIDLYNLRGQSVVSNSYMQGEIKRELKENIEKHYFIKKVESVVLTFIGEVMAINLLVRLEDETLIESEVSI